MFYKTSSLLLMTAILLSGTGPSKAAGQVPYDGVILLHGIGRTSRSMRPLERHLKSRGFRVINLGYPSTKYPIDELADYLGGKIEQFRPPLGAKLHFVTHSLGGIVLRRYLKENRPAELGRVVMLCPPNQGSELVDRLRKTFLFRIIYGPAGQQLGTGPAGVPNQLGPVDFELGVITGNKSLNPLFSYLIPGEDDGKVSVERSKVEGMADFLLLPHSHTFIMNSIDVAEQVEFFLHNGRFRHNKP